MAAPRPPDAASFGTAEGARHAVPAGISPFLSQPHAVPLRIRCRDYGGKLNNVTRKRKLLEKILAGSKNIRFSDMLTLASAFGFVPDRISGSHHILIHPKIPELVNLQDVQGKAKPYQVKQFLALVEQFNLQMEEPS